MIGTIPSKSETSEGSIFQQPQQKEVFGATEPAPFYDKVFNVDDRIVSLTALPSSVVEAILMIVLAQRHYRKNESVTGSEIMDGLQQSGYTIERIDRQMEKYVNEGLVIRIGKARGTRYRLTNQGLLRAQTIAAEVIATVP